MDRLATIRNNQAFCAIVGGVILTIVTISGWGIGIKANEILTILFIIAALIYYKRCRSRIIPTGLVTGFIIILFCFAEWLNILLNDIEMYKVSNYTTLFGLIIGGSMAAEIRWEQCVSVKLGSNVCLVSILIAFLFLPGNVLYGWNSNSAIYVIPGLLMGLAIIYISEAKRFKKYLCFYGFVLLGFLVISELQNRSSLMTLLLMGAVPLAKPVWTERRWFRLFYISFLVMNVFVPLFQDVVESSDLFKDIMHMSQSTVNKGEGFNGREYVWPRAVEAINQYPLFGLGGWRKIYFHNFSLDVLTQFGWVGWIAFMLMVAAVMERCFVPRAKTNVFLFAFIALFAMNTFENALFANNFFVIYPYLMIGAAWRNARGMYTGECVDG